MRTCGAHTTLMAKLLMLSLLPSPLVQAHGPEPRSAVRVWVPIRLYPLLMRLAITITTKLAVSRNGKRFSAWTLSSTQPWMHMEVTKTGHDNPGIHSPTAVSVTVKTSGVILHQSLERGRMARRCWEGRRWTTRTCMKALGWLREDEAVVKHMRL